MTDRRKRFSARFSGRFGAIRYRYALAPFAWVGDGDGRFQWEPPATTEGCIDLRPLAAQAIAGGAPQGFAFVAATQPVTGTEITQATYVDEPATNTMRDAWQSAIGYRPAGAQLRDLLFDQLTNGADPAGESGPKPLMPTGGQLELHLGGHSPIKSEPFNWGVHPHTNRVQAVLQRDFEQLWEERNGDDHCRRVLDYNCEKYRVADWRELVPRRLHAHVPGRLPHATTITEAWPTASSTLSSGQTQPWTEVLNNSTVPAIGRFSGLSGSVEHRARCDTAVSSVDHRTYAPGRGNGSRTASLYARYAAAADTAYCSRVSVTGTTLTVRKVVAGVETVLGTDNTITITAGVFGDLEIRCSGSTISGWWNSVQRVSLTDTAITTGTQGGAGVNGGDANCAIGAWASADLAVGNRRRRLICGAAA
jgi:hypothetical protein